MSRKLIFTLIVIGIAISLATVALAQGQGRRGGQGERGQGNRPLFGTILAISSDSITIEPMIPQEMLDRMVENGRELPDLPAEMTVAIDDATQFYFDSAEASADSFNVGDEIVIVAGGGDSPVARKVADPDTAREYIKNQMGNRGGGQGQRGGGEGRGMRDGGGQGRGNRDGGGQGQGQGGQGRGQGGPPIFGEITAMDSGGATIRIELPDFVLEKMAERGHEPPADMPSEVTLSFGERIKFAQNSELVDANPFSVGDMVAVMARKGNGDNPVAVMIADWASAEARMGQGMGGEGRGPRDGSGPGCEPGEDCDEDGEKKKRRPNRKSR